MIDFLATVVRWVIMPSIMLSLFFLAAAIARSVNDRELKTSAWAGFLAGLVIFVIYMVSQLNFLQEPDMDFSFAPGFLPIPLLIGVFVGLVPILVTRSATPTKMVSVVTLLLSATSLSALFSYIFINDLRAIVLYGALGVCLGILIHILLSPGLVPNLFVKKSATELKSRRTNV